MAVKAQDYVAVAANQAAAAVGPQKTGVLLDALVVTVDTAATSSVSITDGNVVIPIAPVNAAIGVYHVPLGIRSKVTTTPGWKVTTGAGAQVLAILG